MMTKFYYFKLLFSHYSSHFCLTVFQNMTVYIVELLYNYFLNKLFYNFTLFLNLYAISSMHDVMKMVSRPLSHILHYVAHLSN